MRTFISYLYSRFRTIVALALITVIFLWVFTLYNAPADAVVYGALITAVIGLAAAVVDYMGYRRRHKRMRELADEITITLENLPIARDRTERDYEQLIVKLFEDRRELENSIIQKETDMTEYYTMWVHQIKTPIAAMRLTLQGMDTAEARELSEELQRIEQYVEMVLCYLRLDSDSTDYLIRRCDLDEIARQAVRKYAEQTMKIILCRNKYLLFQWQGKRADRESLLQPFIRIFKCRLLLPRKGKRADQSVFIKHPKISICFHG